MYSLGYTQIHDFIVFLSLLLRGSMRTLVKSSRHVDEQQASSFVSTHPV